MNAVTYLALGDSITEGLGASGPETHFVSRLFRHLQSTPQCRLRNMGISGLTSVELYGLMQTPAMKKLLPRVSHITITTGGCDFIEWYEAGMSLTGLPRTMRQVCRHVQSILERTRQDNPSAVIQMMGFYMPPPAYELGYSLAARVLQSMNKSYQKICSKYGVQLVNPYKTFLHRTDYFADEVHPNQKGYDKLARLFIQHCPQHCPPKHPVRNNKEAALAKEISDDLSPLR
ncbi:lipase [Marinithermofilum abyssi]|uniref:Lipase n=1 Tax=Marinithermofilum abyssi TaxID=1571185 RepID=A0A8J2VC22_9BACL|nr:GDSL-type esterase/lipase family protein [Marinithermofilum abyssi]GGE19326.1 lipase [Marinithermofilum abyssi]